MIFKEPVDITILNKIENVQKIDHSQLSKYTLHTDRPEEVRQQLLQVCLKHNLNIVSLQSETDSLEEVFKSLTN